MVLFMCSSVYVNGQYYEREKNNDNRKNDKRTLYERKVESYTKLKRTGLTLATVGGGLTVAGVVLVASVDWETIQNNGTTTFNTNDKKGIVGIYALLGGLPMLVTGIILERIGNHKVNEYSEKLYRLNLSMDYKPNYKGLTLTYRF